MATPGADLRPSPSPRCGRALLNDMRLTGRTRDLLDKIEARLLNPIAVSPTASVCMAARGLL